MTRPARDALHERIDHEFTLHPPESALVVQAMETIRNEFALLAHQVVDLTPLCREQSVALTELDSACRWAISALARNQGAVTA